MFHNCPDIESESSSDSVSFVNNIFDVNNLCDISFSTENDVQGNLENNIITSNYFSDEKQQDNKSTENYINTQKTLFSNSNNCSFEQSSEPDLYKYDKIKELLEKNQFDEIIKYFNLNNLIKTEENILSGDRKKRENGYNSLLNKKRAKRGRKIQENEKPSATDHNKYSPNNIITKIKVSFFENLKIFVNKMLNKKGDDKNVLYSLSNEYKIKIERGFNLELLNMKLGDLLSKDITTKYKKNNTDCNKILIESILTEKVKVEDLKTIKFVFDLKFREWIDLFSCKMTIDDLKKKYMNKNPDVDFGKIDKNKGEIVDLFKKILNKNDEKYLSYFIFCLYNYERWFLKKNAYKNNSKQDKFLITKNIIIEDFTE